MLGHNSDLLFRTKGKFFINNKSLHLGPRGDWSSKRASDTRSLKGVQRFRCLTKAIITSVPTTTISPDSTNKPKRFRRYIKRKHYYNKSLYAFVYLDTSSKVNILNEQISSVFNTTKPFDYIKDPDNSDTLTIKATWPDGISTSLFKELAT